MPNRFRHVAACRATAALALAATVACGVRRRAADGIVIPSDAQRVAAAGGAPARANAFLDSLRAALRLPGLTGAVAVGDHIVWSGASGWADSGATRAANAQSVFRIGSVTKLLTAVAAARLVDRGRLDLDRPVREYLPVVPVTDPPITSRMLGGHLSGIHHYGRNDFLNQTHYRSVSASLSKFIGDSLVARPGTRYAYSSYGFNLLGAVLERASGHDFSDVIRDEVTKPLDLAHTVPENPSSRRDDQASFYSSDAAGVVTAAPGMDVSDRYPSGGYLSSAVDLAEFGVRILRPDYLSANARALLFTPQHTADGKPTIVGFGWRIGADSLGRRFVHHGGEAMGGRAFLLVFPDRRVSVALLTNLSFAPIAEREALQLARLIAP